jgi:hypothetical protein
MNVRTSIAALALAAAVLLATGGRVEAQVVRGGSVVGARTFVGAGGPVALNPGLATYTTLYGSSSSTTGGTSGYIPPYSYYAAIPPAPARIYVDYGNSGFNYYGRPYGRPNDRWSWEALGSSQNLLDRYYYPPVR